MHTFVLIVFIFSIGAIFGWCLEVVYRHFADKEKRWFNPGFCVGPWLPIYGTGLLTAFGITYLEDYIDVGNIVLEKILLFALMSLLMTLIELIAGEILLKYFNLRLWDYSNEKFNYKGFICLKFSFFWMLISAIYYFFIHPLVNDAVLWLSKNLIFSFSVGLFFGIFVVDIIYSGNLLVKIKNYAKNSGIIVKLEEMKENFNKNKKLNDAKVSFFFFMLKENFDELIKKANDTLSSTISFNNNRTAKLNENNDEATHNLP